MFNQYPYLNLNDLNLDYILKAIKEMRYEVTNFVSINAIKYADPIQWNITSQYEKNTIVIDPVTGTAYISVAPVPAGVALTRPEFWTVVFDLGSFVTRAAQNFTSHWEQETTTTATFPSNTGDWLVWGDVLYKVISPIVAGDTYVVNSNIEHFTIEDLYNAYLDKIAQILAMIGDLVDLDTTDKTNLVAAINEVVGKIAQEVTDRTDADDAIIEKIDNMRVYNVRDYGAIGDGVADDTDAIKATFTAANNGIVYFPAGSYLITNTIDVTCELKMSKGCTLVAGADVDVLRLRPNGSISGGTIDVRLAGHTHAAILLLGEDKFSPTDAIHKNSIDSVHIIGNFTSYGIYLHANYTGTDKSYIQNIRVYNCVLERLSTAICCKSDTAPDNTTATWCNGNIFDLIWIQGAINGIVTEGAHIPYEAAGNTFSNIQFQTFFYYTHSAVTCNSSLNTFDVFVWDYTVEGGIENYPAFVIYGDSNQLRTNLFTTVAGHFLDRGSNTNIVSYDNYHYYEMSAGAQKKQIVGDQDDFLFAADKRYTITTTPTIPNIENAFNRDSGYIAPLDANTPYEIIIDVTSDKIVLPRAIGLIFETSTAKNITIEIYYDGSYHTIYNAVNVTTPLVLQTIGGVTNVDYIRISITSTTAQRLARIFAVDSYKKGMAFVENYGTVYHGRLSFTDSSNDGIVLKDTDDGFFYLVGCTNGQLTATKI